MKVLSILTGLVVVLAVPLGAAHAEDEATLECTTLAGAHVDGVGGAGLHTGLGGVGGCMLGTLSEDGIAIDVSPGEGCFISADLDGDRSMDTPVEEGMELPAGAELWAYCSVGTTMATSSATFEPLDH